ncbi:MAG: 2'-5' RNA ligase family protein, partial [Microlunatus sp.]|nr:2'-5' RNA ligase family protein [Microlunatus sp.]
LAAGTAPFQLQLTGPYVNGRGITADAEPTAEWRQLIDEVRTAASQSMISTEELGDPPFAPHISVGHGRADGDSEPLETALAGLGRSLYEDFVIDRIHLLAVDQHVEEGIFDWEPIADFTLAG